MWQMKQIAHSSSSSIKISDDEIVDEAKQLLAPDFDQYVKQNVSKILETWMGKTYNTFRAYTPKKALEVFFNRLFENGELFEYNITVNNKTKQIEIFYNRLRHQAMTLLVDIEI